MTAPTRVELHPDTRHLLLDALIATVVNGDMTRQQLVDYLTDREWNCDHEAIDGAIAALTLREFFFDDAIAALHHVEDVPPGVAYPDLLERADVLRDDAHNDYQFHLQILAGTP